MSVIEQAIAKFKAMFDHDAEPMVIAVPGRVNLIGEHIDYHGLPVLPIAIQKQIAIAFRGRSHKLIRALSSQTHQFVSFQVHSHLAPGPPGHWGNYIRAAARTLQTCRAIENGLDAYVTSDLPMAAGLSSSSALLIAFSLALARVNEIEMTLAEWTALLPDGEQFVRTRGGAMDHVAILASRAGCATLIKSFTPPAVTYIPVPGNWRFLIAHSLIRAEKSGVLRSEYNARRTAGTRAIEKLGFTSYRELLSSSEECGVSALDEDERNALFHVTSEAHRVKQAAAALKGADATMFGHILCESHASLRDRLRVSVPQIDALVNNALEAGAFGARLTGAGFGGCVVCLCDANSVDRVRARLIETYYASRPDFHAAQHLFTAEPSAGALSPEPPDHSNQY